MKKIVFIICALGLASGAGAQEKQALTFDEALNLTLNNNPSLQASSYGIEAAERDRKAAYGLRLPQIGVNGAYVYMSKDISIDMNNLKAPVSGILGSVGNVLPPDVLQQAQTLLAQNWAMPLQDRSVGTVGGTITVPVYTGGKINAANNAAKIKIEETKEQRLQTQNALISELTERYYGLSLALQVVEVRRQVLEGMQHHLEDAKALEANGIIAKSERLYAEMHVAEAEREYLAAQKTAATLSSALSNTLNNSGSYEFQPITNMFILDQIEGVDHFKQLALQNNPLLRQVELKKDLAVEGVRLQRADFTPQIALMGAASFYNYQMTPLMPRWAVGAGVSFKLFNGLNREYKFSAAKSQVKQVEALNVKAQNDILTLIDKLYNEMTTYSVQLPSINTAHDFAVEYLRIKETAFKEGAAPSSDVVDARLNLAKIKIERLQAAYYYDLMLARLLEACGDSEAFGEYAKRSAAMPIRYE